MPPDVVLEDHQHEKFLAWQQAAELPGYPAAYRVDVFGSVIRWQDYGDRSSPLGWEIYHQLPTVLGGTDVFHNIRALHWRNHASLGGHRGELIANDK